MTNPKTSILFWVEMSKMPLDALQSDIGKSEAGTVQAMGLDVGALRNLLKEIKRYAEMLPDEPRAPHSLEKANADYAAQLSEKSGAEVQCQVQRGPACAYYPDCPCGRSALRTSER